jgi:hypothetical protein
VDATPRMRVSAACQLLGTNAVIERCLDLLAGGEESPDFLIALGGAPARRLLADGLPSGQEYWLRVWAMRGLLWAGPGEEPERLRAGLGDEAWRVREMTCKVVARHRIDDLLEDVGTLEADRNSRVREAAKRAAVRIMSDYEGTRDER